MVSKALLRLDLETRRHHVLVDEGWLRLQRPSVTRATYIEQLATTYGFEAPLEAAFAYTPGLKSMIDLRARSRAGLLAQDLFALGVKPVELGTLPQCSPVVSFATPIEALGWMYVTERSTLFHDLVRDYVNERIPDAFDACSYLAAYSGIAPMRWAQLGEVLDRVVNTDELRDELVAAAFAGLQCMLAWRHEVREHLRTA
jgi:heme oxygenase